jgi:fucose permease
MRAFATPARLVMGVFFIQAFLFANWLPRIPDVQAAIGIGPADLAVALIGMSIGTYLALPFVGILIARLTPRKTIMIGFVCYCMAIALPGWSWSTPSLFVALFLIGLCHPVIDVAMNVEAARIEQLDVRRIMSKCHGFWSLGSMLGALVGAGFAQIGVSTKWHLLLIGVVTLPVALSFSRGLPEVGRETVEEARRRPILALPSVSMLGLCVFAFGVVMVEISTRNWIAVYLRDVIGVSPGATGIGLGAFALCMAVGRLAGDGLANRFGPVMLARISCSAAVLGFAIVVFAGDLVGEVIGLAAAGFGVSVAFPLAVSAAAARGDRPPAVNVASLSLFGYSSGLIGPPLVGFIGQAAGLRAGLSVLLPVILLSTLLAGELRRRPSTVAPVSPGGAREQGRSA